MTRRRLWPLVFVALAAGFVGAGTYSAFSSTTSNAGNSFAAGTVVIGDNDGGAAMLTAFTAARPGDVDTSCIKVSYTGSLTANVRIYASTTTGSLDDYLTLTVTRGTNTSPFDDCTNFNADPGDYGYGPGGVVYQGLLSSFPTNYGTGIVDPTTWSSPDEHWYRFSVTVNNNDAAQGQSSTATFTWKAENT